MKRKARADRRSARAATALALRAALDADGAPGLAVATLAVNLRPTRKRLCESDALLSAGLGALASLLALGATTGSGFGHSPDTTYM